MLKDTWPYSERDASNASKSVDVLLSEPEIVLSIEEKQKVRDFALGLFDGSLGGSLKCACSRNLEQIYQSSPLVDSQTFYLEYFDTQQGILDLSNAGIELKDEDNLIDLLDDTQLINKNIESKTRKQLAINSLNWHKEQLADGLVDSPVMDERYRNPQTVSVNYNPQKLLSKLNDLQDYRRFYRGIRRQLKALEQEEGNTNLLQAQNVVLSIYRARIGSMIASLYPDAINLANQLMRSKSDEQTEEQLNALGEIMPALKVTFLQERENRVYDLEEVAGQFSRRLDFLRNGAAWQDEPDLTPVSPDLITLADELTANQQNDSPQGEIANELISKLDHVKFSALEMQALARDVLNELGLLSKYESSWDEIEERDGRSPDGKWQVVRHPKKKSFATDGAKRVLWCPENSERTLTQEAPGAGPLLSIPHEIEHVLQNEFDDKLSEKIALAKIKGRRVGAMREVGTINQERIILRKLGRNREVNQHYLKAIKVKLAGGSKMEAIRAFYVSTLETGRVTDDKKARDNAVDRVFRLYQKGGYDSSALEYLEQELIRRSLSELPENVAEAIMVAGSSFSLKDLARLHQIGLVELPKESGVSPADEVWRIFTEKYLPSVI